MVRACVCFACDRPSPIHTLTPHPHTDSYTYAHSDVPMKQLIEHLDPNKKVIIHDLDETHLLVDANYVKVKTDGAHAFVWAPLGAWCRRAVRMHVLVSRYGEEGRHQPTDSQPHTNPNAPHTNPTNQEIQAEIEAFVDRHVYAPVEEADKKVGWWWARCVWVFVLACTGLIGALASRAATGVEIPHPFSSFNATHMRHRSRSRGPRSSGRPSGKPRRSSRAEENRENRGDCACMRVYYSHTCEPASQSSQMGTE